jgi:hypothetical protein
MISLKPLQLFIESCPSCHQANVPSNDFLFQGSHVLSVFSCGNCGIEFMYTLPIGHAIQFPLSLFLKDKKVINRTPANQWLAIPLQDGFQAKDRKSVSIQIKQNRVIKNDPILLNCLDDCFGHLYAKLWNAQSLTSRHPNKNVIVLIPSSYSWMVPEEVAEIWMVDIPITSVNNYLDGLDTWIKKQLERFEKVNLSQAYIHLDHHKYVNIEKLLGQRRFDLNQFQDLPVQITFILREDRFWHGSRIMDILFRLAVKFNLRQLLKGLFLRRQKYLIHKTARKIQNSLTHVQFNATGLGKSIPLGKQIKDLRVAQINFETESIWNRVYSQSHIVIGVHGSHMLLPTSLAAGFINLLPRYKIDHIVEDTLLPYSNRMLQFMGRFLDESSSSFLIATHAVSIVKCFSMVYENSKRIPE